MYFLIHIQIALRFCRSPDFKSPTGPTKKSVLMVADDVFPLCMDVVEVMVVRMVQFVNQRLE